MCARDLVRGQVKSEAERQVGAVILLDCQLWWQMACGSGDKKLNPDGCYRNLTDSQGLVYTLAGTLGERGRG